MSRLPLNGLRIAATLSRRQLLAAVLTLGLILQQSFLPVSSAQLSRARVIPPPDAGPPVEAIPEPNAPGGLVSLNISGAAVTENFNTLANTGTANVNTLPTSWQFVETGTGADTNYIAGTGSNNDGGTYSFGASGNTERALGQIRSGSVNTTVGASFTNNTGRTITSLDIAYVGEQWRIANTAAARDDRMDFQYSLNAASLSTGTWTDTNALDFTNPVKTAATVGALDGNAAANRAVISSTISGLSIPNGATFWIRWMDLDATGSDDGLAIDDFSLTPQTPPPTLSVNDVSQNEGNSGTTPFTFTINLSSPAPAGGVSFNWSTADGTAQDNSPSGDDEDYNPVTNGSGSIPAGNSSTTITVQVNGDTAVEQNETFFVNLSNVTNAAVSDAQGQGTIVNDDTSISGSVLISEFRTRGPNGENDEFFEIHNNGDTDIIVTDGNLPACLAQAGLPPQPTAPCGWALVDIQGAASTTPIPRFIIPHGTTIPARGSYLAAGSTYGLAGMASPDLSYTPPGYPDADFNGFALFNTALRSDFNLTTRLDAVGFDGVNSLYREGTGLLPATGITGDYEHSFVRRLCYYVHGVGCTTGAQKDTGNNRTDFALVATDPTVVAGATAILGAPGPENLTSPRRVNPGLFPVVLVPGVASSASDSTALANAPQGTISLRRRYTNNTGAAVSRLRFRVYEVTTVNSETQVSGVQAVIKVLDASDNDALPNNPPATVRNLTIQRPPEPTQGGGLNSALVIEGNLIPPGGSLAPGASVDVEFLLGVVSGGKYRFNVVVEALPGS